MGFFDKIKSIKNVITGGAAEVFIETGPLVFGEPFDVTVKAHVDDADLKASRVYLEIQGCEEIEVPDTDVVYESDGEEHRRTEIVRASYITLDLDITIAEDQELEGGETYEWTTTIELPEDAQPTYSGRFSDHRYMIRASLDCFGNDPDSGWHALNLR